MPQESRRNYSVLGALVLSDRESPRPCPRDFLTEDTGRGQSRWFRVEACSVTNLPRFWGRPELEFGVPAQNEDVAVTRSLTPSQIVKRTASSSFINY